MIRVRKKASTRISPDASGCEGPNTSAACNVLSPLTVQRHLYGLEFAKQKHIPGTNSTCHAAVTAMASATIDSPVFGTQTLLGYLGETRGCMLGTRVPGCGISISAGLGTHQIDIFRFLSALQHRFSRKIPAGFSSANAASRSIESNRVARVVYEQHVAANRLATNCIHQVPGCIGVGFTTLFLILGVGIRWVPAAAAGLPMLCL